MGSAQLSLFLPSLPQGLALSRSELETHLLAGSQSCLQAFLLRPLHRDALPSRQRRVTPIPRAQSPWPPPSPTDTVPSCAPPKAASSSLPHCSLRAPQPLPGALHAHLWSLHTPFRAWNAFPTSFSILRASGETVLPETASYWLSRVSLGPCGSGTLQTFRDPSGPGPLHFPRGAPHAPIRSATAPHRTTEYMREGDTGQCVTHPHPHPVCVLVLGAEGGGGQVGPSSAGCQVTHDCGPPKRILFRQRPDGRSALTQACPAPAGSPGRGSRAQSSSGGREASSPSRMGIWVPVRGPGAWALVGDGWAAPATRAQVELG